MSLFLTGATGYLGGYVLNELLTRTDERIAVLVRGKTRAEVVEKLWRALQLHRSADAFYESLPRIDFAFGDLHAPRLGLDEPTYHRLVEETESVLHIAASLNRKSDKACFNTNLRGTLSVIQLARAVRERRRLRRFSYVSTVAVAGARSSEVVLEDSAIDWSRSDYDPYGRTKKFTEHMIGELLQDVPVTIFRPSIVMGDPNIPETTQFDMVKAVSVLADLRLVPLRPETRVDIVSADYVGRAIAALHLGAPKHRVYHLSSGERSCTVREIAEALERDLGRPRYRFAPSLERPMGLAFDGMNALPGRNGLTLVGALMKVFWPYVTYDTVFNNQRVVDALGEVPKPFTTYSGPLLRFARQHRFRYPYRPLPPAKPSTIETTSSAPDSTAP